jgi:hypothetical protein
MDTKVSEEYSRMPGIQHPPLDFGGKKNQFEQK